jgi:hypothetical protein
MSVSAVNRTVNDFDNAYFASLEQKEGDTINLCAIPGYIDMIRDKAFLSSQVKLAESDSVGLLINVRDSVIQLLIKGLPVGRCRLTSMMSRRFFSVPTRRLFTACSLRR